MKPCAERRFAAKLVQLLPGPHEDVLRDLVGLGRAEHPPSQAVDARDMRPVEALEGRRIPARGQSHICLEHGLDRRTVAGQRHRRGCCHSLAATTSWMGSGYRRLTGMGRAGTSAGPYDLVIETAGFWAAFRPARRLTVSAGLHSRRSSKYEYTTGVTSRVSSRQSTCPPRIVTAIDARDPAPAPLPNAIGSMPATMAMVVIRIGRRRTWLAAISAAFRSMPWSRSVFV